MSATHLGTSSSPNKRAGRVLSVEDHVQGLMARDRGLLSRTITLTESSRQDHRDKAQDILQRVLPRTGKAIRLGVSGVPGVGKSTFIEALGMKLVKSGHRVAVLAIDPSSSRTGGSILGDKTRMPALSLEGDAYIRPSPTSGTLGGVTRVTRESMLLCEAAGFDVILVETVGVGQSETVVADMVDCYLVLMLPGAGDELQGIKKGVLELADIIAVNKADGVQLKAAGQARASYQRALSILQAVSSWKPQAITVSSLAGEGLDELWDLVRQHRWQLIESGEFESRRENQRVRWLWSTIEHQLMLSLTGDPVVKALVREMESGVRAQELTIPQAASRLLEAWGQARGASGSPPH